MTRVPATTTLVLFAALQATSEGQQPLFRTETRLVALQATVTNRRGELVTNLDQQAFTVYEDGKRQPITLFRRDDVPVSLGLLIDNSGSMRQLRAKVEAAALAFVRASNPQDETFVLELCGQASYRRVAHERHFRARSRHCACRFDRRHSDARRDRHGRTVPA